MSEPVIEFFEDEAPVSKEVRKVKSEKKKIEEPVKIEKPVGKKSKLVSKEGDDLVFNFPSNVWMYASLLFVLLIGASIVTHGFTDITGYFAGTPDVVVPVSKSIRMIKLTDASCAECSSLDIHDSVLAQLEVNVSEATSYDISSAEGQALVNKYVISEVPTVLLSPELRANYSNVFTDVYSSLGSVESDGWYVFRGNAIITGFVYRDLISGEILGLPLPGNFLKTGDEVCVEGGKPVVYLFTSTTCGYCAWERPVFINATIQFGNWTGYDGGNDLSNATFESDYLVVHAVETNVETDSPYLSVFSYYGGRGVPFIVLGCSYYRPGAGTSFGEEAEYEYLTAAICALTKGGPSSVCDAVADISAEFD